MAALLGRLRRRYTLERLKVLHSDLVESIDASGEDLGPRRCIDTSENALWEESDNDNDSSSSLLSQSLDGLRRSLVRLERRRRSLSPLKRLRSRRGPEIAAAFRLLAATRSPDREGDSGGAALERDDDNVYALNSAKKIERRVVNIIREIGEVVANGEKLPENLACDPCFEYFCEKNLLSLLVDIAKENPIDQPQNTSAQHGVVWSPLVKAQVLHTVSLLIHSVSRNSHSLFYILSQNAINDLIACMLPLQQWSHPALEKLMPAFVDLLKNLSLLLAGNADKDLFPFFTVKETFPVLHAALEIGTSSYAQTDSFVHITCLSLIVNIMKIENPTIVHWVSTAALPEMRKLCNHLGQLLLNRFRRIAEISTGPIVDGLRRNAVARHLTALHDQIQVLNDVFSCGIPGLNVRLCELLMRRVVRVLLKNIEPPKERAFLDKIGVSDLDVIPHRESEAQVALFFLAQLFHHVDYLPFVRMISVALFHPKTTKTLIQGSILKTPPAMMKEDHYVIVPALDAIAQGKAMEHDDFIENPFRRALLKTLKGDFGAWRFPVAAIVVESVLWSDAMDMETLQTLEIVPRGSCESEKGDKPEDKEEKKTDEKVSTPFFYKPTAVEESLIEFLTNGPLPLSSVSTQCLECAGSLSLSLFYKSAMSLTLNGLHCESFTASVNPFYVALFQAKVSFSQCALDSQKSMGVADIYLELVEAAVCSRYRKVESPSRGGIKLPSSQPTTYAFQLSQIGCAALESAPENLVRSYRCVKFTDVEKARYNIEMAIYFRSLCQVTRNFLEGLPVRAQIGSGSGADSVLDLVHVADDFALTFGGLRDRPDVGMELDLRGRMTFPCCLSPVTTAPSVQNKTKHTTLGPAITLVLVVDPTDLYVVKTTRRAKESTGKIVCRVALTCVIAAASDSEWLHIAVRHPDVGLLIKNGNMVLQFDTAGTCLIVRQYLDRSRNAVRRELMEKYRSSMATDTLALETHVSLATSQGVPKK